jgi:hypothetical protein
MWYRDGKEQYFRDVEDLFRKCDNESRIEIEESDRGKFLWNEFDKAMQNINK